MRTKIPKHVRKSWHRARRLALSLKTPLGRKGLRRGVAPTGTPAHMLKRLQPDYVVDVGANRGQFTLDVLIHCPNSSVLAIEPLASEANVFESVLGDDPRVRLIRTAVGSHTASATMHVTRSADSSSLLPVDSSHALLFKGTRESSLEPVPIATLSSLLPPDRLPPRSLLKADVQGFELEVIVGAGERLSEFAWIYLEVSFIAVYIGQPLVTEIVVALADRGFAIVDSGPVNRVDGQAVQIDLLFERTSTA